MEIRNAMSEIRDRYKEVQSYEVISVLTSRRS